MKRFLPVLLLLLPLLAHAQEQVDLGDVAAKQAAASIQRMAMRVRVTKVEPASEQVKISWRRGGEGLGGTVTRGEFLSPENASEIPLNTWSAPAPLEQVIGRAGSWHFPSVVVASATEEKPGARKVTPPPVSATSVEFEFLENGKVFKSFTEEAPRGATVGFAFPGRQLDARGSGNPEFVQMLRGLSGHARARREMLEKSTPAGAALPKLFGIVGHLGGYGDVSNGPGKGGGSGFGVRQCNPAIVGDECRTMRMLGINGITGPLKAIDAAGMGEQFRRVYFGGPGSGNPMAFFGQARPGQPAPDGCPFDPALQPYMAGVVARAIEEHREIGARESWGLWDDEIGVYAKDHIVRCERCAAKFREYLQKNSVSLSDLGAATWEAVQPYDIWGPPDAKGKRVNVPTAPEKAGDALRYYYTGRFMTYATGQVYPASAKALQEAGIYLYAMQGPTPSWSGSSLDWHEFYDLGANTAFVFETSNRDPRSWQWESYLGDLGRGIAQRHGLPMGSLIKPHRGAPAQRMLSLVARGVRSFEWYTYGPDYAKGDSFSQSDELLRKVAQAAQFLGQTEDFLYGAKFAHDPEVAFVSPRSSELMGRGTETGVAAFENAKWVYLALAHAHVPVAILSEQQLAEGGLEKFKLLYVIGPHLRRDAGAKVQEWVRRGGTLFTDALGLSRDEANQPARQELFGARDRQLESWGTVEPYKATQFSPMTEPNVPAGAAFEFHGEKLRAAIGREPLAGEQADVLAKFADGKPAFVRHKFGTGQVMQAGIWSGLTYSATVRRKDFDMRADFSAAVRDLIALPAKELKLQRLEVSEPLLEAVVLENKGHRGVSLMNWAYSSVAGKESPTRLEQVRLTFPAAEKVAKVRSLKLGDLPVKENSVVLPSIEDIDLLMLE